MLFLVDRGNLGRQALKEFQQFDTPDDGRKFTELYNVQHLQSNMLDPVSRVVITTIQRLYSMLKATRSSTEEPTRSRASRLGAWLEASRSTVGYNPTIPIETFDVIVTDECHRSIYNLWRQVLEYFDAFLIGLTATPVEADVRLLQPEPGDGVRPRAGGGGRRERGLRRLPDPHPDHRERGSRRSRPGSSSTSATGETRQMRWEQLDEDLVYDAQPSSTARSSRRTRSAPSSARSATSSSPRSSPAAPRSRRR